MKPVHTLASAILRGPSFWLLLGLSQILLAWTSYTFLKDIWNMSEASWVGRYYFCLLEAGCRTHAAIVWYWRYFYRFWDIWLVFHSGWIVTLKEAVGRGGRAPCRNWNNNPRLHSTPCPSEGKLFQVTRDAGCEPVRLELLSFYIFKFETKEDIQHTASVCRVIGVWWVTPSPEE
jgi:hypothetical protein